VPHNTFYNTAIEKQKLIVQTGIELFSKYNFEDVDVKMIVNKAGIPRGSFYAYFSNIEDFYLLVVNSLQTERVKQVKHLAEGFSGNFFTFLIALYRYDIKQFVHDERKLLLHHYFRFIQTQKLGSFKDTIYHRSPQKNIYDVLATLNVNRLNGDEVAKDKKESIIDFCMTVYLATYNKSVQEGLAEEESVAIFSERIKIIERGI